jgi:hypothetical protein
MTDLAPLIEQVRQETHPYVVVGFSDEGILWRAESQGACQVMADIMGDYYVMTREYFLETLEIANAIQSKPSDEE